MSIQIIDKSKPRTLQLVTVKDMDGQLIRQELVLLWKN